jgi:hypothetical protein
MMPAWRDVPNAFLPPALPVARKISPLRGFLKTSTDFMLLCHDNHGSFFSLIANRIFVVSGTKPRRGEIIVATDAVGGYLHIKEYRAMHV